MEVARKERRVEKMRSIGRRRKDRRRSTKGRRTNIKMRMKPLRPERKDMAKVTERNLMRRSRQVSTILVLIPRRVRSTERRVTPPTLITPKTPRKIITANQKHTLLLIVTVITRRRRRRIIIIQAPQNTKPLILLIIPNRLITRITPLTRSHNLITLKINIPVITKGILRTGLQPIIPSRRITTLLTRKTSTTSRPTRKKNIINTSRLLLIIILTQVNTERSLITLLIITSRITLLTSTTPLIIITPLITSLTSTTLIIRLLIITIPARTIIITSQNTKKVTRRARKMVGRRVLNPKTRNLPRLQLGDRLQPLRSLIPMERLPAQILVLKEETLP